LLDFNKTSEYILTVKIKKSKYFLVFLLFITAVYAGAYIDYFHARSDGEDVRLEWKTGEENNLQKFVIERKSPQTNFAEIGIINPTGSNSFYSFTDKNAYKSTDLLFNYRLKIVDNSNQVSYSHEVPVSHSVSGVKRTWGSIKAMFR
jgi:Icc-related predicted phosphoesterase